MKTDKSAAQTGDFSSAEPSRPDRVARPAATGWGGPSRARSRGPVGGALAPAASACCTMPPTRPGGRRQHGVRRITSIESPLNDRDTPRSADEPPRPTTAATAFVLVTVFLDSISIGLMLPALPKLISSFVPEDPVFAAQLVGIFAASWGLMQLFGSPFLGALSDRYGRRPIILISNVGLAVDYLLMAVAPTIWLLFFGRLVSGFTASTFATSFAYVTDVTPPEQRAAAYGRIGAVFGLGFIIGPAIGGVLAEFGPRVPFILAAGLAMANTVYGFFVLPESLLRENRMAFDLARANPFASLQLLRRTPRLAGLAVVNLLDALALVSITATFVLYTTAKFQWTDATIGLTFAAIGLAIAIVQGGLTGLVVARIGERRTLMLGLTLGIVGFSIYGLAPSSAWIWVAIPILAMWGLADSPNQSLMTREVNDNEYGQLQGALAALAAIAETIGPLIFSQIYAYAIGTGAAWLPAGAPFLLAATLHVIALGIAAALLRREP